mgnify:CR=1 FL=1
MARTRPGPYQGQKATSIFKIAEAYEGTDVLERTVAQVNPTGELIKIQYGETISNWIPARNYTYED